MDLPKTQIQSWPYLAPAKDMHASILSIPEQGKNVVNLQMSKNIQTIFGVTIPIGSGKRVSFNNYKMSTPKTEV